MPLPLTPDVFRMLLAVGWIDGHLDDEESEAVLRAARAEGFEEATLAELAALSRGTVEFGEIDATDLGRAERLYIYGVASWVARCDEILSTEEWVALHAIATVVGVTARGREAVDEIVEALVAESDRPVRLDLEGLKARLGAKLSEVATSH